jgi:hypothetical protein
MLTRKAMITVLLFAATIPVSAQTAPPPANRDADRVLAGPTLDNSPYAKTENPRREPPRAQTEFACQYIREQADRSYRKND